MEELKQLVKIADEIIENELVKLSNEQTRLGRQRAFVEEDLEKLGKVGWSLKKWLAARKINQQLGFVQSLIDETVLLYNYLKQKPEHQEEKSFYQQIVLAMDSIVDYYSKRLSRDRTKSEDLLAVRRAIITKHRMQFLMQR